MAEPELYTKTVWVKAGRSITKSNRFAYIFLCIDDSSLEVSHQWVLEPTVSICLDLLLPLAFPMREWCWWWLDGRSDGHVGRYGL